MSKIAFVFPGQGTQYVGMGKELYENNELAKKEFDKIFSNLDFEMCIRDRGDIGKLIEIVSFVEWVLGIVLSLKEATAIDFIYSDYNEYAEAVSYTHLDVYKRQHPEPARCDARRQLYLPCRCAQAGSFLRVFPHGGLSLIHISRLG